MQDSVCFFGFFIIFVYTEWLIQQRARALWISYLGQTTDTGELLSFFLALNCPISLFLLNTPFPWFVLQEMLAAFYQNNVTFHSCFSLADVFDSPKRLVDRPAAQKNDIKHKNKNAEFCCLSQDKTNETGSDSKLALSSQFRCCLFVFCFMQSLWWPVYQENKQILTRLWGKFF